MKKKAFTLIETLLSLSLVLLLTTAMIFSTNVLYNNKDVVKTKVEEYLTLNRYVKYNTQLKGIKSQIIIDNKKIKVFLENSNEVPNFQKQIDNLNQSVIFEANGTNVVTYLPDGSIEDTIPVNIITNETNIVSVEINEWNQINVITNENNFDTEK